MKYSRPPFALLLLVAGCRPLDVNLSTPEPIVVDVNMRVDVYDRGGSGSGGSKSPAPPGAGVPAADARRRARMGDIQTLKNSRLVGEGRDGLLLVREQPEGAYGKFVAKTVADENADRLVMMRQLAIERSLSLEDIQKQQGELWRNRSFSGEWIEKPQADGTWDWAQKG
ncbi:MAG: DUF1318 domain-containing protein [Chthoniobacterales bacterium]|nr:DUF1318 domain-containing protein [Chthoniobacterales bacterium]